MELKNGKITKVLEKETGTKKDGSGEWVKQSFIVETGEKYNNVYCFELFGDEKVDNFNKYNKVGDLVDVDFNVKTNEWQGKYFTTLQAWKVFKSDVNNIDVKAEKIKATEAVYDVKEEQSDLPF
jgi:sporulation protein YlmC with PRC-barrel domain